MSFHSKKSKATVIASLGWLLTAALAAGTAACGNSTAPTGAAPHDSPNESAVSPVRKWGYIPMPDGSQLRFTVLLPSAEGRFPILVEYDGYGAGSGQVFSRDWLAEGYGVMGVSVPGSACSTGDFKVFHPQWGEAGAAAIEWAAKQPWSDGRMGMMGLSFSGYMQLWAAANRPASLLAISPAMNTTDPYRDVAYPGGIFNERFPPLWWAGFPNTWNVYAADDADRIDGDSSCRATAANNSARAQTPELNMPIIIAEHPFYDELWAERSAVLHTQKINIPTLGIQAWQDEQVGSRMGYYEDTIAPEKMWLISFNGVHITPQVNRQVFEIRKRFMAHFVKGEDNGFEHEPHGYILHEVAPAPTPVDPSALAAGWVSTFPSLPAPIKPYRLALRANGVLSDEPAAPGEVADTYNYPVEGPGVNNPFGTNGAEWAVAVPPGGHRSYTTAALPEDLQFYGEGSADLWISSTAPDTDLQVTLTEVRPDGQEMFVQRGWLRASHRALDSEKSNDVRAWHPHTQSSQQLLTPLVPVLARVEINKFSHVFRKGSSLRLIVDTPSPTGYWGFAYLPTASQNSIWHDPEHPSELVLGYLPGTAQQPLPACGLVVSQPCRANAEAVPDGVGPRPPTP